MAGWNQSGARYYVYVVVIGGVVRAGIRRSPYELSIAPVLLIPSPLTPSPLLTFSPFSKLADGLPAAA